MTRLGYARVSTTDQDTELQIRELEAAGCERIYRDHGISGTKTRRSELDKMLERLSQGDEVVVWKLDRLGRNTATCSSSLMTSKPAASSSVLCATASPPTLPATWAGPWHKPWSPSFPPSPSSNATNSPNAPKPAWPSPPPTAARRAGGKSPPATQTSSKPTNKSIRA